MTVISTMGYRDLSEYWEYFVVGIVSYTVLSLLAQGPSLHLWDEAIYAHATRLMLDTGDWWTMHVYDGFGPVEVKRFFHKPPLFYWLQGIAIKTLGFGVYAVRLPTVLAGTASAILTYHMARKLGSKSFALFAPLVLLLLRPTLTGTHNFVTGDMDGLLTFFGSLFVWLIYQGRNDSRKIVAAGVPAGLVFLSKGINAGIFLIIVVGILVGDWSSYVERFKSLVVGGSLGVIVASIWPVSMYLQYGNRFLNVFLVRQGVNRALGKRRTTSGGLFPTSNYPYFESLGSYFGESMVLVVGVVVGGFLVWYLERRRILWLLWWIVSFPLVFSALGGNHMHYVFPMVIPISVLAACSIFHLSSMINISSNVTLYHSLILFVIVSVSLALVAPPAFQPSTQDIDQRDAAITLNQQDKAVVYVDPDVHDGAYFQVFWSYIDSPVRPLQPGDLNQSKAPAAVVSANTTVNETEYSVLWQSESAHYIVIVANKQ